MTPMSVSMLQGKAASHCCFRHFPAIISGIPLQPGSARWESNLKVIQSIMGHKNIETTMDVYAEATDRKKEETFENLVAKLDELF